MKKLRVGVIGVGHMGAIHTRALSTAVKAAIASPIKSG